MVIAFSIILCIRTFITVIQNNTNPSSIAIHVPGESFNDILGRFIVFDHTLLRNTTKVVEWFLHDIAKTKLKKHIK